MGNLHRYVRIGEIVIVTVLAVFALITYRELSALRKFPVSLPSYQFEVSGDSDATQVVNTRGTWFTEKGAPEELVTTTIECRKEKMECVESTARVQFVSGQGLLESQHTSFVIAHWNDSGIVTRPAPGACATRQLILEFKEKRALSKIGPSEEKGRCRELPARTLELVTGYKIKALTP
jgi:hypothetical protein